MDLITRDIINKNITFKDVNIFNLYQKDKTYTFLDLSQKIDFIKNILQHEYNCVEGQTVLIGITPCIMQLAVFFACAELGLTIVIVDHNRNDAWINPNYIDPKTESLLPIDYFIVTDSKHQVPKHKLFYKICNRVISIKNFNSFDYSHNDKIIATKNSILLKCTSSGTTGTAKLINHTHEFLYNLIQRNKIFFYGNVCIAHNLNHGSSPATYFLPSLCSESTNMFVSYMITYATEQKTQDKQILETSLAKFHSMNIDHLMIPYPHLIDNFLVKSSFSNLNLYTLSTIKKEWLYYYLHKKVKNIISIFGSNETSGPTLINEITDPNFQENKYKLLDDFYKINLLNDELFEVTMPIYDTKIITQDLFKKIDNCYYHIGRNDLYRVNGLEVPTADYNKIIKQSLDADLIIDTVKNSLYVCIWSGEDISTISQISTKLEISSQGAHKINKYAILNKSNFMSGVKLDMELLRDYFRKFVVEL